MMNKVYIAQITQENKRVFNSLIKTLIMIDQSDKRQSALH